MDLLFTVILNKLCKSAFEAIFGIKGYLLSFMYVFITIFNESYKMSKAVAIRLSCSELIALA